MEKKFNIVLVEDEIASTQFFIMVMKSSSIVNKLTCVESGPALMKELKKDKYDVAVVDYFMEPMNGLDVLNYIKKNEPHIKIIMHTAIDDIGLLRVIIDSKVNGLLHKLHMKHEAERAIVDVMRDAPYISPAYLKMIQSSEFLNLHEPVIEKQDKLSDREMEVMILNLAGLTAIEIGDKICIVPATAEKHMQHVHAKTNEHSTYGLIRYCLLHKFFTPDFFLSDQVKEQVLLKYRTPAIPKNK